MTMTEPAAINRTQPVTPPLQGDLEECHPPTEFLQVGKGKGGSNRAREGGIARAAVDCLALLVSFAYWQWAGYWQRS
jgi:hypothetical protein